MFSIFGLIFEETPKYQALATFPSYQIRRYAPQVRIQHTFKAPSPSQSGGIGFRPLASFIFGNNKKPETGKSQSISMTAPVLRQHLSDEEYKMEFVLPSEFETVDKVPKPNDARIVPHHVPEQDLAVITFSGSWDNAELVAAKEKELREAAMSDSIELDSDPTHVIYAGYNPPWTPTFLRTNEIMIPVLRLPQSLPMESAES